MTVTSVFSRSCDANSSTNQHFTPKQMENDPDPAKLVFLGDPAVGKTSFLLRFNNGELTEREDNLVVFDFAKRVAVDGTSYHVNFWDMSGALEDRLRPLAYPGTSVFMLCFDIANRDSFENIKESWITEIRHYMPNTPFLLIGNKMDLRDAKKSTEHLNASNMVSTQEAWELARLNSTIYVENSAITGEQVTDVVNTAIRIVAEHQQVQKSKCRCHRLFKWMIKCKRHK